MCPKLLQLNSSSRAALTSLLIALVALLSMDHRPRSVGAQDQSLNVKLKSGPSQVVELRASHPVCRLGNDSYPLGHRWAPSLPDLGLQPCVACECTLRRLAACYEPVVNCRRIDKSPGCPALPDRCADGAEPRRAPGQCCRSCPDAFGIARSARPAGGLLSTGAPTLLLDFDQAPRMESFWIFKIIAKDQEDRELISAVKSVPFCAQDNQPQPATSTTTSAPSRRSLDRHHHHHRSVWKKAARSNSKPTRERVFA